MRISTKDPAEMSAAQINKELDRLEKIGRRLGEQMVAAGRGYERPSTYMRMTDPLSRKLRKWSERDSDLRAELYKRQLRSEIQAERRRRRNPDDAFWDEFAERSARAFWAEAYIREVEDLANKESEYFNEDLYADLSPGHGDDWLDLTPPTPESALREGRAFTAQARKNVPADVLPLLEDLGAETAGWYAAMGAMGHGVGLFDYDVPHKWVGYWEPGVDVQNDAYDAVREAAADYYGE